MTLNQLRSFLAVADNGSVRAAAEELVVTQAAVSASVAALQKSLGVALVTPDGRGLRLTEAGTSYARYARRILGLLDEAARSAAAAADPERGELRIAAVTTAAEQIVPHHPRRLPPPPPADRSPAGSRQPRPRPFPPGPPPGRPGPGRPPRTRLERGGPRRPPARAGRGGRPRASRRVPGRHPRWCGRRQPSRTRPASSRGWRSQTWLLREPGSGTRASTDALLADLDISPLTLMVGSNVAIRESAQVGLGVTLLSRDAVAAELAAGKLAEIPVPGTPLHRDWYLLAHPGRLPPPAARLVAHAFRAGGFRRPDPADRIASR